MYYKTQALLEMGSTFLASGGLAVAVLCATVPEPKNIEGIIVGSIVAVGGFVGCVYLMKCEEKEEQRERKYLETKK